MAAIESPDMSLRLMLLSDLGWFWCKRLLFERNLNGAMIVATENKDCPKG